MNFQPKKSNYKNAPPEQLDMFLDFQQNHPYATVDCQGHQLQYIATGTGETTLLFLHGALVRPDMWFYPILALEQNFRIIVPLFEPQHMGAQEAATFIRAIFAQEQITQAVVIGYSYGGGVAQYLSETQPELIEKLVLTHTGIVGRADAMDQVEKARKMIRLLPFFLTKKKLKDRITDVPRSKWNEFHQAYFLELNAA